MTRYDRMKAPADGRAFDVGSADLPATPEAGSVAVAASASYNVPEDLAGYHAAASHQHEETPAIPAPRTPSVAVPGPTGAFARAFDTWWRAPDAVLFPYTEAQAAFFSKGKHFVEPDVLQRLQTLKSARARVTGEAPDQARLDAYLDCALDKVEGRYNYASYCALPLLDLPDDARPTLDTGAIMAARDDDLLALLGDLLRFEADALEGSETRLPGMRPSRTQAQRRVNLCIAALRPVLRRKGYEGPQTPDVAAKARHLLGWCEGTATSEDPHRLGLSVLPVHTLHDEYLFLRVLQVFEANFAWIGVLLRQAIECIGPDSGSKTGTRGEAAPGGAGALLRLRLCNDILRDVARLFPLIGSMQPAAFHEFRRYTEGASAIQSHGYKLIEALCAQPDGARLDSVAYTSVPAVRAAVQAGQITLEEAFLAARDSDRLTPETAVGIEAEMARFAAQILRWRQAHFAIARRFLGDLGGTGYTEGVPYLDATRGIAVFRHIPPAMG